LEEVRFGMIEGNKLVMESKEIANACKNEDGAAYFRHCFAHYFGQFDTQHLLNTYVFCASEHDENDNDGLLSMWRGYGANGNGVAIVFDMAQLNVLETSPLIIAHVAYDTTEVRLAWLKTLLSKFAKILGASDFPNDKVHLAAYSLFERIKLFALFTKHHGFKEEKEWRVVYMPDRDIEKKLEPMLHYSLGSRGVEPKLRFKVLPVKGVTADDLSLTKITERIILGPSVSSPLAPATVRRMFDLLNHPNLKSKLWASMIPFRAIS
jgi:hypothetical protein